MIPEYEYIITGFCFGIVAGTLFGAFLALRRRL